MSTFAPAELIKSRKKIRKTTLSQRLEKGVTAVFFIIILAICLLSLVFLTQSNKSATKGYELKRLRDQREALLMENDKLKMQIADLRSIEALENDPKISTMVDATNPQYIRGDTAVAQNEN
jgi:hypothetical protein